MALQARVPELNHQGHMHGACNVSARLSHHAGRTVADEQQSTSPSEQLSLKQLQNDGLICRCQARAISTGRKASHSCWQLWCSRF